MLKLNYNLGAKGTKEKGSVCVPIQEIRKPAERVFKIAFGVLMLVALFIPILGKAVAVKMSALYMFSNDGKVSGRTGGNVHMRNGRSRAMAFPALVRNVFTGVARGSFSTFSTSWRALSALQITAWNNWSYSSTDRFGRSIAVKGKQAYIGVNTNLANVSGTALTVPPVAGVTPNTTQLNSATISVGGNQFDVAYDTNSTGAKTLVFATKPLSAGISRPSQSAFRLIGVVNTVGAGPADIWIAYLAKYGNPTVGARVFVQFKSINGTAGLASAITSVDAIVGA